MERVESFLFANCGRLGWWLIGAWAIVATCRVIRIAQSATTPRHSLNAIIHRVQYGIAFIA